MCRQIISNSSTEFLKFAYNNGLFFNPIDCFAYMKKKKKKRIWQAFKMLHLIFLQLILSLLTENGCLLRTAIVFHFILNHTYLITSKATS